MYLLTDNIDDDVKLKLVELGQASMQLFEYAPYGHKWSCASDSEGDSGAQNDGYDSALCSPQFVVLKRGDEQADNPGWSQTGHKAVIQPCAEHRNSLSFNNAGVMELADIRDLKTQGLHVRPPRLPAAFRPSLNPLHDRRLKHSLCAQSVPTDSQSRRN
jgi:hypothetical protein